MAGYGQIRPELGCLLEEIAEDFSQTQRWTGRKELSPRILAALSKVQRDAFVSTKDSRYAFENRPLSIGCKQTISQPFIVAIMTELLDPTPQDRVLEIGTGSGYQTAILAEIVSRVYSIETISELAQEARRRLTNLSYGNIAIRTGDGWDGWREAAPFDGIIVTAAPIKIPPELVQQLKIGGRLVIPVGPQNQNQMLYRCVKRPDGTLHEEQRLPVAFVPMVSVKS